MKIKLKDLKPNPFKKFINEGKLNEDRIEKLVESIGKDGFWDNVICRKSNEEYQLAYGHHRIEATKRIFGDTFQIDIPCKNLSDEAMLRILGNENNVLNEEYSAYQIDQVVITKKFLEEHPQIAKSICPTAGRMDGSGHQLEVSSARVISTFLGEKNWSKSKVADLLKMANNLHPIIIKELKNVGNTGGTETGKISISHGRHLARLDNKKDQLEVFKKVKKYRLGRQATDALVHFAEAKKITENIDIDKLKEETKMKPTIEEVITKFIKSIFDLRRELDSFIPYKKDLKKGTKILLESSLKEFEKIINKYFEKEI